MGNPTYPGRWPQVRVLLLTLYGEYEAKTLADGAEETVKIHLFASVPALLEQAPVEGAKSEVD